MQTGSDTQELIEALRYGELAIFPTDTVFGIGCRIDFPQSVARVYAVKQRATTQPMPILLADASQLAQYVAEIPPEISKLTAQFWPGALTVALPTKPNTVLPAFLNGNGAASFRVPKNDMLRGVIRELGVPIVGTSANFHGQPSPTQVGQIDAGLMKLVAYVFEGPVSIGRESTVIELVNGHLVIHREGSISEQALRDCIGAPV